MYKKDIVSPNNRKNIILYNPAKGLELLASYIASHTNYEWKPLYGFSEEEMVNEMQHAKLYIDFGSHPGKDRIPREAASCGCVIITNRKGSAAYFEDVPIQDKYKFESPEKSYEELTTLIDDVFVNFSEHFSIFSKYREIIRKDEETFNTEVLDFVTAMEI
ncbi:MAG: hypothetical protein MJZ11_07540 [Lachnospiraceae bacterium]|nr:hypothetical protein [Lachnospiraceae bacterium]